MEGGGKQQIGQQHQQRIPGSSGVGLRTLEKKVLRVFWETEGGKVAGGRGPGAALGWQSTVQPSGEWYWQRSSSIAGAMALQCLGLQGWGRMGRVVVRWHRAGLVSLCQGSLLPSRSRSARHAEKPNCLRQLRAEF